MSETKVTATDVANAILADFMDPDVFGPDDGYTLRGCSTDNTASVHVHLPDGTKFDITIARTHD